MAINYFEQFVAPGIQRGLQDRQLGLAESQMAYERQLQDEQRSKQAAFSQDFSKAWESGKESDLTALIGKHPQQIDSILGAIGIKDQRQRAMTGTIAQQLSTALQSGNTNGALGLVQQNADFLRSIGQDPDSIAQEIQSDPASVVRGANQMMMLTMTPDQLMQYQQKEEDQQLKRDQMSVTMRGQDITAATAAADRAQRAQSQADSIGIKLMELGQKPKLSAGDIKGINSDITTLKKDADVMYGAARDLQTIRENATPAAQLAAIFKYMKALDPTSVVREGEQVMLQKTGGVFDTVGNYINQLNNGSRLNAKQLKDLTNTAKRLSNTSAESVNKSLDDYLGTYGDTLTDGQRKLFQNRKLKTFDVGVAEQDEISKDSQPPTQQPKKIGRFNVEQG